MIPYLFNAIADPLHKLQKYVSITTYHTVKQQITNNTSAGSSLTR